MVDYKAIGRRIAFNRNKAKMTQGMVAEKLDVSESFISQIERGKAKISLPRLFQLAEIFNVDVAVLVSDGRMLNLNTALSEVEQLIQDWTPGQRDMLFEIIACINNKMKSS